MRRSPRSSERGFTLVEVVLAAGLWIVLGGSLLVVAQGLLAAARTASAQQHAYAGLTQLIDTLDAESSSALAIFVPQRDIDGKANADGHELDFYSRDAARYGHFWAYRWDHDAKTLQRYVYSAPGSTATPSDPPLGNIVAFSATRKPASSLAPAFANGYLARDVAVNFNYPNVDGGNAVTSVTFADARDTFTLELLPGTMTSGFAVVVATFTPTPSPASPAGNPTSSHPTPMPSATVPGPEYMHVTTMQDPDTETVSFYESMLYVNPPGTWDNIGASVPVITAAIGQTVYLNASCATVVSGNQSAYGSELQSANATDPSGYFAYQCAFTPSVPGWLSIGYWNSSSSPAQALETILVGGYGGPFNNNAFPSPSPASDSSGGG